MLFAIKNCLDLKLYTQDGKEIYNIDYANDAIFRINEWETEAFLCLKHEFTDFDLDVVGNGKRVRVDFSQGNAVRLG